MTDPLAFGRKEPSCILVTGPDEVDDAFALEIGEGATWAIRLDGGFVEAIESAPAARDRIARIEEVIALLPPERRTLYTVRPLADRGA